MNGDQDKQPKQPKRRNQRSQDKQLSRPCSRRRRPQQPQQTTQNDSQPCPIVKVPYYRPAWFTKEREQQFHQELMEALDCRRQPQQPQQNSEQHEQVSASDSDLNEFDKGVSITPYGNRNKLVICDNRKICKNWYVNRLEVYCPEESRIKLHIFYRTRSGTLRLYQRFAWI